MSQSRRDEQAEAVAKSAIVRLFGFTQSIGSTYFRPKIRPVKKVCR